MTTTARKLYFADGKHRIEGVDISVKEVMQLLSSGMETDTISDRYPQLSEADIKACIAYALKNIQ